MERRKDQERSTVNGGAGEEGSARQRSEEEEGGGHGEEEGQAAEVDSGVNGVQKSSSGVAEESWVWQECSDYFDYSYSISKQFVDLDRKSAGSDFIVSVRLHNNEIGRQVSQSEFAHYRSPMVRFDRRLAIKRLWFQFITKEITTQYNL